MSERQRPPGVRLFLDTNVLVSAIAFRGPERWLLRLAGRGDAVAVVSPYVLSECARVMATKLQAPLEVVEEALAGLPVVTMSEPKDAAVAEARAVVRDAGDAPVLAAAWQAGVDALVTGDKDLHAAQQDRVRVLRTNEALARTAGVQPAAESPP